MGVKSGVGDEDKEGGEITKQKGKQNMQTCMIIFRNFNKCLSM